jgi:hypothetical protein
VCSSTLIIVSNMTKILSCDKFLIVDILIVALTRKLTISIDVNFIDNISIIAVIIFKESLGTRFNLINKKTYQEILLDINSEDIMFEDMEGI